jgi:hypothetical protein
MLNQWQQYINTEQFEMLITFIKQTKQGKKNNRLLCLVGESGELVKDIIDIIGKDDCEFCNINGHILQKVPRANDDETDDESDDETVDESDDEDDDDADESMYTKKKLLLFQEDIFTLCESYIKEVLGVDPIQYYDGKKNKYTKPVCNLLVKINTLQPLLEKDLSINMRAIIIDINK